MGLALGNLQRAVLEEVPVQIEGCTQGGRGRCSDGGG